MTPYVNCAHVYEFANVLIASEWVDDVAIQSSAHSYTIVRKQPYRDATHDLACSLSGPVADMMTSFIINRHLERPDDAMVDKVLAFARASQDGSTINSAGKILRRSREEIAAALPAAFDAASRAFTNVVNCTARHAAVFKVLEQLEPHECLVIDHETLAFLRGARKARLRLPIVSFGTWYNAGITPEQEDARNEELRQESMRIHDEMVRLGQIDTSGITPAGLRRLQLNESR